MGNQWTTFLLQRLKPHQSCDTIVVAKATTHKDSHVSYPMFNFLNFPNFLNILYLLGRSRRCSIAIGFLPKPTLLFKQPEKQQRGNQRHHQADAQHQNAVHVPEKASGKAANNTQNRKQKYDQADHEQLERVLFSVHSLSQPSRRR